MAMQEYKDGSFGKIKPLKDKLFEISEAKLEELVKTKAIHIGTKKELEDLKKKTKRNALNIINKRMDKLEAKVNKILIHLGIDDKSEILVVDKHGPIKP